MRDPVPLSRPLGGPGGPSREVLRIAVGVALGALGALLASSVASVRAFGKPAPTAASSVAPTAASSVAPTAASSVAPARRGAPDDSRAPRGPRAGSVPRELGAEDVVDYTLRATLDASAHTVHGEGTIRLRNYTGRPLDELWLHLYLNAFKNERTAFLRTPVGSGRGLAPLSDGGFIDVRSLIARELDGVDLWRDRARSSPNDDEDETDIRVPLPRPLAPGAELTLDMVWDDKLPALVERTGYAGSFHMVAQWFPKLARLEPDGTFAHFAFEHLSEFYADFGTYDVTLDVPASFVVGATGVRVSDDRTSGRTRVRYHQESVHDFAWTAWDGFAEREALHGPVGLRCLYPRDSDGAAQRELSAAAFALDHFGARYGEYPYTVLTLVHPPPEALEAGGMEYPTLITTGGRAYLPPGVHDLEDVTVHEFGHQYFYGLLASNEARYPVLDEGLNTYAESVAMTERFGPGSALDLLGLRVSLSSVHRWWALEAGNNEPVGQPAAAFATGADYGASVYARTGTLLVTFGNVYGRERLDQALAAYARTYRFRHPDLRQFLEVLSAHLGEDAGRNLEDAISRRGWVDYAVIDAASHRRHRAAGLFDREGGRETVLRSDDEGWEGDAVVVRRGSLALPVDVVLSAEDGSSQVVRWSGDANWTRVPYRGPSRLVRVHVDPTAQVLLDENLFNNARSLDPPRAPVRSLERAAYWVELALAAGTL